ncbi:iron ABC transporter permease [Rhizobium sp. LC145]|uniref:ABC transporter permease n=1 Tax=Rhizobium sp. LC145 TaxID=1120688 RepID=UPI00062A410B|nr:iron ABC transporter permease [Rhizobium sp. LC145]KKX27180.1 ABC transporter permease [Rhizobium sp. LC145]TKT57712.1 iron ABC transporter permease [Rhizobiaceae bacterium LC148]
MTIPLRRLGSPLARHGLTIAMAVILIALVAAPLVTILIQTLQPASGAAAWMDVLTGRLSQNLFWRPTANTMIIGLGVAAGCVLLGGFLAWLVVMTDIPGRPAVAFMATLPFMIPSFATALAWGSVFRNGRVGGGGGLLEGLGFSVPDWLSWGMVPTIIVLIAHYYALAFTVIAAALATVNGDLVEAAQMTGASRKRILLGIVLPVVAPAIIAGGSLAFAGAVSNFAAPALLGLPVRMQTLSTRLFGMIEIGQTERGYVLAILLITISAVFLGFGNRILNSRRSFATISGKGARPRRFSLGGARLPLAILAWAICILTTILPILLLLAASLAPSSLSLFSGWSLHYWIGHSDPAFARGQPGIFHNPQLISALTTTVMLGAIVAVAANLLGILIAVALTRQKVPVLSNLVSQMSFLPMLLPGIAFAAAYIALYGAPIGPLPALYGTKLLLALALTAAMLPFAVQTGRATVAQISGDIDEAARMTGAGFFRRLGAITLPLAIRGLAAGLLISFVNVIGDLAITILLYTPTSPMLAVLSYSYASDGFHQFANAVTLVILVISMLATGAATLLHGRRRQNFA